MSFLALKEVAFKSVKSMAEKIPDFSKDIRYASDKLNNCDAKQEDMVDKIPTRNQDLEGKNHPETGVHYERKTVENSDGDKKEGVFPVFESEFDAELPDDLLEASDKKQFDEANTQLKEYVENNPGEAKSRFTSEQLEDIESGRTPEGCTWHHSEDKGVLQLVDTETHAKTGHTGGKTIWGGGNENR